MTDTDCSKVPSPMKIKDTSKAEYHTPTLKMRLSFFAEGAGGEKTEAPTPKRRKKAREEGQVAMSPEVGTAFLYIVIFTAIKSFMPSVFKNIQEVFYISLDKIQDFSKAPDVKYAVDLINFMFLRIIIIALPLLLVALVVGLICNFLQVGWNPTLKPMQPKFSKLNPIAGIKRMFSFRAIVNFLKSILKLGIIGYVIIDKLSKEMDSIPNIINLSLMDSVIYIGGIASDLGVTVGVWFLIIAALDFSYQKFKHEKDLKMSKYEIKQEYKESEGDPQIKGKIRRRMQEASMRRMMQAVPTADVIITNPTHYAVAISYDREGQKAPLVVAKGVDYVAQRIKEKAKEANIEIVENRELARALYSLVDIGKEIPPELYQAVAEILAFVYKLKNKI